MQCVGHLGFLVLVAVEIVGLRLGRGEHEPDAVAEAHAPDASLAQLRRARDDQVDEVSGFRLGHVELPIPPSIHEVNAGEQSIKLAVSADPGPIEPLRVGVRGGS